MSRYRHPKGQGGLGGLVFQRHLDPTGGTLAEGTRRHERRRDATGKKDAAEKCGEGTHLEDGVCVLDETVSAESTPASSTSSAETVSSWIHSITFAILIAFVIAILLFLISRASRRKTT